MAVGSVIVLMLALTKVWLLGEFNRRGVVFRRKATSTLIAAVLLSGWARSVIPSLLGGERESALQAYAPFTGRIDHGKRRVRLPNRTAAS